MLDICILLLLCLFSQDLTIVGQRRTGFTSKPTGIFCYITITMKKCLKIFWTQTPDDIFITMQFIVNPRLNSFMAESFGRLTLLLHLFCLHCLTRCTWYSVPVQVPGTRYQVQCTCRHFEGWEGQGNQDRTALEPATIKLHSRTKDMIMTIKTIITWTFV